MEMSQPGIRDSQVYQSAVTLIKKLGLDLVVSDQSDSRLKEYPRTVVPDQQTGTAQRNLHHPGAGVADP